MTEPEREKYEANAPASASSQLTRLALVCAIGATAVVATSAEAADVALCDTPGLVLGHVSTLTRGGIGPDVSYVFTGDEANGSGSSASGAPLEVALTPGLYTWEATAPGYLAAGGVVSVCTASSIYGTLVPDEDVVFSGTVFAGQDDTAVGSAGALVSLDGTGARFATHVEGLVGPDGRFELTAPAGFYQLSVSQQRANGELVGDEFLRFDVAEVELLASTEMTIRTLTNTDRPDYTTSCSSSGEGRFTWASLLFLLGLMGTRWTAASRRGHVRGS